MTMAWTKSGRCESSSCFEARDVESGVEVRNNTDPGLVKKFTYTEWAGLIDDVKSGKFDLPSSVHDSSD